MSNFSEVSHEQSLGIYIPRITVIFIMVWVIFKVQASKFDHG